MRFVFGYILEEVDNIGPLPVKVIDQIGPVVFQILRQPIRRSQIIQGVFELFEKEIDTGRFGSHHVELRPGNVTGGPIRCAFQPPLECLAGHAAHFSFCVIVVLKSMEELMGTGEFQHIRILNQFCVDVNSSVQLFISASCPGRFDKFGVDLYDDWHGRFLEVFFVLLISVIQKGTQISYIIGDIGELLGLEWLKRQGFSRNTRWITEEAVLLHGVYGSLKSSFLLPGGIVDPFVVFNGLFFVQNNEVPIDIFIEKDVFISSVTPFYNRSYRYPAD